MDDNITNLTPRSEALNKIVDGNTAPPVAKNEDGEEMISRDAVDQYIQDRVNELYADKVRMEKEERLARLKVEEKIIAEYNSTMKDSDEPWVDLKGYTETANGMKISLDWNDAFVEHLRAQGMKGADEDTVVHTWLSMLMENITKKTDDGKGDFED